MDELNNHFGRLSTDAAEWRPSRRPVSGSTATTTTANAASSSRSYPIHPTTSLAQHQQQPYHQLLSTTTSALPTIRQSDLNAVSVKEFVPGRGWTHNSQDNSNTVSGVSNNSNPLFYDSSNNINATNTNHFNNVSNNGDGRIRYHGNGGLSSVASSIQQQHLDQDTGAVGSTGRQGGEMYESTVPSGPAPPPIPAYRALHSLGVTDDLWRHHREMSMESVRQMDPSDPRHKAIPMPYCNAYCLDAPHRTGRSSMGYPSSTFQVASREDGNLYCLRRFDSVRSVSPKIAAAVTERWTTLAVNNNSAASPAGPTTVQDHPGIVPFVRCFVASRAVFFVHHYIPGARNLQERLGGPLSENILWSCVAQLVSAIRVVHSSNLAVRSLRLQHVLANSDSTGSRLRLRLNCLGMVDALEFEARKHVADLQRQDIRDLGRLILSMATGTEVVPGMDGESLGQCEAFLMQNYSLDLHNLAMTLIRSSPHPPGIVDVCRAIAQRSMEEQDAAYRALDRTERALATEYESGRALRLLIKMGFINERPEFGPNRRWSQSGDCYVLTLFRDFVFHQANGSGNPIMDLGHVITSLNKLDAADEEKIVLTSRDGKSLMVVSYADVARCLENAYHELCSGSMPPSMLQY